MADEEDEEVTGEGDKIDWKARYINQRARTKEQKERADQLDTQIKAIKPKAEAHDGLAQQLAAITKERDDERAGRGFDRAVAAKGITDPEAIDLVRSRYSALPEKDRPAPDAYVDSLTADPAKTPKWLSGYLQPPAKTEQQGTQTQQQTQQGQAAQSNTGGQQQVQAVNPNRTAVSTTGAHGAWVPTPEDRARAHAMAVKGDYSHAMRIQAADGFAPLQLPGMSNTGGGQQGGGGQNTNGVG